VIEGDSKTTRGRSPAQDEALERVNRTRRYCGGLRPKSHNIVTTDEAHKAFAALTPRQRGELIEAGLEARKG